MSSVVRQISDAEFTGAISQGVTLVDFWAPWCGPCKQVAPVLDELAQELKGQVSIAKLNVDDHPDTPGAFGIMSIPTMILFKDGKPVSKLVGALPKAQIREFIGQAL